MMRKKGSKRTSQAKSKIPKDKSEDFQLSEHFSFFELTRTYFDEFQKANRDVDDGQVEKLVVLCETILEPIRKQFRLPVTITSGYRCEELNERVGGSEYSQHALCEAADFIINGLDDLEGSRHIFEWIYKESDIKFGQLIHERVGPPGKEKIWIHISLGEPYRSEFASRLALTFHNGKYEPVKKAK